MELSIYDIIVGPIVSNKAYRLHQTLKKITVEVHPASNKILIAQAMYKLFNVKVASVRVMIRKGKRKISKTRNVSVDNLRKIAIITLQKGQDMNLFSDAPVSMNPTNVVQSHNVAAK